MAITQINPQQFDTTGAVTNNVLGWNNGWTSVTNPLPASEESTTIILDGTANSYALPTLTGKIYTITGQIADNASTAVNIHLYRAGNVSVTTNFMNGAKRIVSTTPSTATPQVVSNALSLIFSAGVATLRFNCTLYNYSAESNIVALTGDAWVSSTTKEIINSYCYNTNGVVTDANFITGSTTVTGFITIKKVY